LSDLSIGSSNLVPRSFKPWTGKSFSKVLSGFSKNRHEAFHRFKTQPIEYDHSLNLPSKDSFDVPQQKEDLYKKFDNFVKNSTRVTLKELVKSAAIWENMSPGKAESEDNQLFLQRLLALADKFL
jgi:hypothetical protein